MEDNFGEIESDDVLLATSPGRSRTFNWVNDSGCTYHVCSQKDHFIDYKSVKNIYVSMGNCYHCKVHGINWLHLNQDKRW